MVQLIDNNLLQCANLIKIRKCPKNYNNRKKASPGSANSRG